MKAHFHTGFYPGGGKIQPGFAKSFKTKIKQAS